METEVKLTKLSKCAGCGAKVGAGVLAKLLGGLPAHTDPNLLVGFDRSDDASVYRVSDTLALVQTVDFFPPIVDDPYLFGQIAATNALSDVYAMGGEPKLALNLLCVPEKMPSEAVRAILAGGYDKVYEAGAIITGGPQHIRRRAEVRPLRNGFRTPGKGAQKPRREGRRRAFSDETPRGRYPHNGGKGGDAFSRRARPRDSAHDHAQ